jgi:hypothetical protein
VRFPRTAFEEINMTLRSAFAGLVLAAGLALPAAPASAALLPISGPLAEVVQHPAQTMAQTAQYYERRRRYDDRRWGPPRPAYRRMICRYEPRRVFNPRTGRWVTRSVEICSRRRW